ncbi:MAG: MoaD/ThiS family protein [Anaerolineae bacterium]|jgi:molybdopterin synthase catalytic subunit|nr:MoaD/ThiS family protein [Anaerolineae bacterium]MBT4311502.1 MoaD/ThiS family protein [Anaerolineae bacterium]MBT4456790.1 MoaD/ThiS family protein [Anaerolineae bacterium]MBT6062765.1 MoaD/ThiS family protein [Anaerolineae bacterium]MBT6321861.1 MoaD/ThiS family protein [Anaerolineae bacterium]
MNKVKILFFATLRTRAERSTMELELPNEISVADFKEILIAEIPALEASLHHTLLSVNKEYAFDEDIIPKDAEIALFPPVSGG